MDGASEKTLNKCVLFGGTQLLDSNSKLLPNTYSKPLKKLLRNAAGVWMRDIYSAIQASRIRGVELDKTHGIDASLLLSSTDTSYSARETIKFKNSTAGVFSNVLKLALAFR